uniref:Uncharacterized protein n=1 Tax=Neolamprologus brichardi TaxID=32507 RepID=A0A3Q4MN68_NEOBR
MDNIIFAERENAGLHAPTQKMRQRLQSAPEKLVKSPTKTFSTPLPSGRKAFGCLNVKVSTPAISKQEKKLLKQVGLYNYSSNDISAFLSYDSGAFEKYDSYIFLQCHPWSLLSELDAFLQTLEELTVELPPEPDTD